MLGRRGSWRRAAWKGRLTPGSQARGDCEQRQPQQCLAVLSSLHRGNAPARLREGIAFPKESGNAGSALAALWQAPKESDTQPTAGESLWAQG